MNDRFGHAAECHELLLTGVELDIPKEYLSDLVYGKTVTIPDIKIDRYGRTVSRAMLGNMDAGLEQINAGMAWHFKKYQHKQSLEDRLSYNAAEVVARKAKVGLWSNDVAKRPEDFRSENRSLIDAEYTGD